MSAKKYIVLLLYDFIQFNYMLKPILGYFQKDLSIKVIALNNFPLDIKDNENIEFISYKAISKEYFLLSIKLYVNTLSIKILVFINFSKTSFPLYPAINKLIFLLIFPIP